MEPRARLGKNRGVQAFDDQPLTQFLFSFGDEHEPQQETKRVLDDLITDFITEICFEAHRSAYLASRQKIKVDDIKFACRKSPQYLGKIEEVFKRKMFLDKIKKLDVGQDKIGKGMKGGGVEGLLDDADTVPAFRNIPDSKSDGGKSTSKGKGKGRGKGKGKIAKR